MRRIGIITIILVAFVFSSIFAAEVSTISVSKPRVEAERIVVPLELANSEPMTALDLPLEFSKGVTLEEVQFEGTLSESFDFRYANIDNSKNLVVLGFIPMVYGVNPDLASGKGVLANLVFSIQDPDLKAIELTPTTIEEPSHVPMFIYTNDKGEQIDVTPELVGFNAELPVSDVSGGTLPKSFALRQNAPNPFNPTTVISYDLPKPGHVSLEVFNVLGQKVKTLVNGFQEAGSKDVIWDGTDNSGSAVASGIYFYRIGAGEFNATKKMMMLK